MIENEKLIIVSDKTMKFSTVAKAGVGGLSVYNRRTMETNNVFSPNMEIGEDFGAAISLCEDTMYVSAPGHKDVTKSLNTGAIYVCELPEHQITTKSLKDSFIIYSPLKAKEYPNFGADIVTFKYPPNDLLYVLCNGDTKTDKKGSVVLKYKIRNNNDILEEQYHIPYNVKHIKVYLDTNWIMFITENNEVGAYFMDSGKSTIIGELEIDSQIISCDNKIYCVDNEATLFELDFDEDETLAPILNDLDVDVTPNEYHKVFKTKVGLIYGYRDNMLEAIV